MTTTEKNIEEFYIITKNLVWRCIISEDKNKRMYYGRKLLDVLKQDKKNAYKMTEMFDDMVNKLIIAGKTINEQNEWLDCLDAAMGDKREEIINIAATAQKVLSNYKKGKYKRKD